jgi:hypothetical protein
MVEKEPIGLSSDSSEMEEEVSLIIGDETEEPKLEKRRRKRKIDPEVEKEWVAYELE